MRFCIIGNSHAGALISAHSQQTWRDVEAAPELYHFTKPGLDVNHIGISDGYIYARNADLETRLTQTGSPNKLRLANCDAIVLSAMSASMFAAIRLLQSHNLYVPNDDGDLPRPGKRAFLSPSAYKASLSQITRSGAAWQFARAIRQASSIPIFVVPQPYPSALVLETIDRYPLFHRMHKKRLGATLANFLESANRDGFHMIENLHWIAQPQQTIQHGFLTNQIFTRGALRLSGAAEQPKNDVLHANAKLGMFYWQEIETIFGDIV